jgi:CRISPR-associated endonuclease Cas3-HD
MLSKSTGLSFELHSKSVARIAEFLAKKILNDDYLNDNLNKIIIAALIHDIGKCNKDFQEFLIKKFNLVVDEDETPIYLFHQELSWAVAMCILDKNKYESALNAIYWHHAKPFFDKTKNNNDHISNILDKITDDDIINIYDNLLILIPNDLISFDEFKIAIDQYKQSAEKTPKYYSNITSKNSKSNNQNWTNKNSIIYRSIIISADRISSKLSIQEHWLMIIFVLN